MSALGRGVLLVIERGQPGSRYDRLFVVRRFIKVDDSLRLGTVLSSWPSIEKARASIEEEHAGLECLARTPSDPARIVETWADAETVRELRRALEHALEVE